MIRFAYADRILSLPQKNAIKAFVAELFRAEKKPLSHLQYIFCSDDYLLGINQSFLQHDDYTDIITFGLSAPKAPIEGEIYISVDRVKENAQTLQTSFKEEMLRVIFHGALHLCGYKDKKKSESVVMRSKEEQYLRLFEKRYSS
jgi:rRNA maturation RNase YbeY